MVIGLTGVINMSGKRTPAKIDNAIHEFKNSVARIKTKKNKAVRSAVPFSHLSKLERNYIELLRRTKNLMKSKAFEKSHADVLAAKAELDGGLFEIRKKYITNLSDAYKYNIDTDDILNMPEYKDFKFSVQDLIFKKIVGDIIPEHPKDEFKRTRLIKRHFVIHCGDTNTGKTYHALKALEATETDVYLTPMRLLALQVFQT